MRRIRAQALEGDSGEARNGIDDGQGRQEGDPLLEHHGVTEGFQAGGPVVVEDGDAFGDGPALDLLSEAVPLGQEQDPAVGEVSRGDRGGLGEGVALRDREDELLPEEGALLEGGNGQVRGDERAVDLARVEHVDEAGGLLLDEEGAQIGALVLEAGEDPGDEIGAERREDPDAQGRGGPLGLARDLLDLGGALDRRAGTLGDIAADRGQSDRGSAAVDEVDPEFVLQAPDLHRQGRLRDAAGAGRGAETAPFGHRHEVFETPQVHASMVAGAAAPSRMRWSNAVRAAVAPDPSAVRICL
ncbi:MAG: hypothetical protein MR422_00205 [Schaalia hyovaginalis]|nr:hypothetical protein [Schaalia hyovaginalis]MCI6556065.1 hypothetical protein [Schaalia hyovaginalis]